MNSNGYLKTSNESSNQIKQPLSKSRDNKIPTSRNILTNHSYSRSNNTTGRMQYYPRLPNLYQEPSIRNTNEYLSDYTKAIVFCENYFIQNKFKANNAEEYKRKLFTQLKGVFRASHRLALFKEVEKYIDFCLLKEKNALSIDHMDKKDLNDQLHFLKEDVALMHDNNQYNGMKPVLSNEKYSNSKVNDKKNKQIKNSFNRYKKVKDKDKGNKDDSNSHVEYIKTISFNNECCVKETNSNKREKTVSNKETTEGRVITSEQINLMKKLLENSAKKPKRKPKTNPSLQKQLQTNNYNNNNNNSLFSSIYEDVHHTDNSFLLSSHNNRQLNKTNASFNLSECSSTANPYSKLNQGHNHHNNLIKTKAFLISNSNSAQNIISKNNPIEWDNNSHTQTQSPLLSKQRSKISSKTKSYIQYQPSKLNNSTSSNTKCINCLKKNVSCPNYQQVNKPIKGKKMALLTTESNKQQPNQAMKSSSKFEFDSSCRRKLTEDKKKMTLQHFVLYFSLRLKINSLLLVLLKSSSVYNRNVKSNVKSMKYCPMMAYRLSSLKVPCTKKVHAPPYKKVILPSPEFLKGSQANGKVQSSNESSFSIQRRPTFK